MGFARFESSFAKYKNGVQHCEQQQMVLAPYFVQQKILANHSQHHVKLHDYLHQNYEVVVEDGDYHNHMLTNKEETTKDG